MLNNRYIRNILSALGLAVFGAILLNLTFLANWGFHMLINLFFPPGYDRAMDWYPPMKHVMFLVIMAVVSVFIFRSKIRVFFKATYATIPSALVFVTIGIFLYRWPAVSYSLAAIVYAGIIFYLYRRKKPWLYYYSVTLVAAVLLYMGIMGIDI